MGVETEAAEEISSSKLVKSADKKIVKKVKRKASAYNRRYAAAFKRLKKKHPRTPFAKLSKRAHREARR